MSSYWPNLGQLEHQSKISKMVLTGLMSTHESTQIQINTDKSTGYSRREGDA